MLTLIDYGMGNIGSIANMIRHCGDTATISGDPATIARSEKLILPGIGSFNAGMAALRKTGCEDAICIAVSNGATLLGICLGMQLLLEESEEGNARGLALISGRVRRLSAGERSLRVPHMGWNRVTPVRPSMLFSPDDEEQRFYFVHSYFVDCEAPDDVSAVCEYGQTFAAAIEKGRVMGVQFHPEKSHRYGMSLFRRFLGA